MLCEKLCLSGSLFSSLCWFSGHHSESSLKNGVCTPLGKLCNSACKLVMATTTFDPRNGGVAVVMSFLF